MNCSVGPIYSRASVPQNFGRFPCYIKPERKLSSSNLSGDESDSKLKLTPLLPVSRGFYIQTCLFFCCCFDRFASGMFLCSRNGTPAASAAAVVIFVAYVRAYMRTCVRLVSRNLPYLLLFLRLHAVEWSFTREECDSCVAGRVHVVQPNVHVCVCTYVRTEWPWLYGLVTEEFWSPKRCSIVAVKCTKTMHDISEIYESLKVLRSASFVNIKIAKCSIKFSQIYLVKNDKRLISTGRLVKGQCCLIDILRKEWSKYDFARMYVFV